MDFDSYLDEAVKKTGLTYKERLKRLMDRRPDLKPEHLDAIHAHALKHHITDPEKAVDSYKAQA